MSIFTPTTEKEIEKLIKTASSATCDLDPIPTKLLKTECLEILCPVITNIVNLSMSTGTFPTKFKHALVRPLLKKSHLDAEIMKNYRPVSNLTCVSKLIEKIVAARLQEHMKENELNEIFQSAYKKGHSTETALLRVHNDILSAIDKGHAMLLVLLDLSAAFDTIDHDTLLTLLQDVIGVEGIAHAWFQSYLSGRTQSVAIDGILSALIALIFGVPQGSVLGPLLFCVYILLLGKIIRRHNMNFHIYADDTQIYCSFSANSMESATSALERIAACISDIRAWMAHFKLKMNEDKTEFVVVSSPHFMNALKTLSLSIGNITVVPSDNARNLGVLFDSHLNMKKHITSICRSAFVHLRKIGAVRKFLSDVCTAQLVHAFVTSRLDYCNSLLAGLPNSSLGKLQKVQNTAARIITRTKKYDHITPILIDLHWLPISLRVEYKILLLTFRAIRGLAPAYLTELIAPYNPSRCLRSSSHNLLQCPKSRLATYGDRAFCVVAPKLWNSLPLDLRSTDSLNSFKSGLKTVFFERFIQNPSAFIA